MRGSARQPGPTLTLPYADFSKSLAWLSLL